VSLFVGPTRVSIQTEPPLWIYLLARQYQNTPFTVCSNTTNKAAYAKAFRTCAYTSVLNRMLPLIHISIHSSGDERENASVCCITAIVPCRGDSRGPDFEQGSTGTPGLEHWVPALWRAQSPLARGTGSSLSRGFLVLWGSPTHRPPRGAETAAFGICSAPNCRVCSHRKLLSP